MFAQRKFSKLQTKNFHILFHRRIKRIMSIDPSQSKQIPIPIPINMNSNTTSDIHKNIYDHHHTKIDVNVVQNTSIKIQNPRLHPTVSLINPLANTPNKQHHPKSAPVTPDIHCNTYYPSYPQSQQQKQQINPTFYIQSTPTINEHSPSLPTEAISNINLNPSIFNQKENTYNQSARSLPCTPIGANLKPKMNEIKRNSDENIKMRESPLPKNKKIEIIPRKTIIIFDWDDTLLPSHFLQINGLRSKSKLPKGANARTTPLNQVEKTKILLGLRKLEHIINNLLFTAIQCVGVGNVIIITNAEQGWVEMSCFNFLPNIVKILRNCRIISARSTFEKQYPSSTIEWKRRAIKLVIDQLCQTDININKISAFKPIDNNEQKIEETKLDDITNTNTNTTINMNDKIIDNLHVISFGDSMVERQAVFDVCKCINFKMNKIKNVITKSIKLLATPTIDQLIDELQTIQKSFSTIISHNDHLDYQVQVM